MRAVKKCLFSTMEECQVHKEESREVSQAGGQEEELKLSSKEETVYKLLDDVIWQLQGLCNSELSDLSDMASRGKRSRAMEELADDVSDTVEQCFRKLMRVKNTLLEWQVEEVGKKFNKLKDVQDNYHRVMRVMDNFDKEDQ